VSYFTLRPLSKKVHGGHTPYGIGDYLGPGQSVLSFSASRSSFLIGELHLGKLGESVVVHGNAPHDRPGFFVSHLIGNRASFLCTEAPMLRVPEANFLQGITSISGRPLLRVVSGADGEAEGHQPRKPPQPPPAWLLQNTLVNYAFLNNRCVFWTTDLAGPVNCGAMGQTFHDTCAYDLGSCLFAPKICSLLPKIVWHDEQA
jgi:hypothetical protein